MYLHRAVDPTGQTLVFLLNETRCTRAAKRFFSKVLDRPNITAPRVINVDKNPYYIGAVRDLRQEKQLPEHCRRRPTCYMNNMVEQDHRFMKRPIPRTSQKAKPAPRKHPSEPDRPLTQEEIDHIMSEVYRIMLAAGAKRRAEEESGA